MPEQTTTMSKTTAPINEEGKENETRPEIPSEFLCPLSLEILHDPVVSRYGQSFERAAILEWLGRGNDTCPLSRRPLRLSDLITNHRLRSQIQRWQIENEEDVTVFFQNHDKVESIMGYVNIPEIDPDATERSEDDAAIIREFRAMRSRRASMGRQRQQRQQHLRSASMPSSETGVDGRGGGRRLSRAWNFLHIGQSRQASA